MQAYKCDRCGKLYAAQPECELDGIGVAIIGFSDGSIYGKSKRIDVCEDCAKSFILWFKEPHLSEITKGEFTEFEDDL